MTFDPKCAELAAQWLADFHCGERYGELHKDLAGQIQQTIEDFVAVENLQERTWANANARS